MRSYDSADHDAEIVNDAIFARNYFTSCGPCPESICFFQIVVYVLGSESMRMPGQEFTGVHGL